MSEELKIDQLRIAAETLLRSDSWENLFTNLGIKNQDTRISSQFKQRQPLTDEDCYALYRQNWLGNRMVAARAGDATKAWLSFECEDDPELATDVEAEWRRLRVQPMFKLGLTWADVYGGSAALIGADDGQTFDKPLDLAKVKDVKYLHVIDRRYVFPEGTYNEDVSSWNFGQPELYRINPTGVGGQTQVVHWTRLLRFYGQELPTDKARERWSWGDSIYESCFNELRNLGTVMDATASACQSFTMGVLSIEDLTQLLSTDQEAKVVARLVAFKLGLSMANLAMIDSKYEKFERMGQQVTGLHDLIEKFQLEAIGAVRTPESKLYGAQQGRLAGSTEDTRTWNDYILDLQEKSVLPGAEYLTKIILAAKNGPRKGAEAPTWSLRPNPIAPPDLDKEIDRRFKQAQSDNIYYQMGAVEASEFRESRFGGPDYSHSTTLDPDLSKAIEDKDKLPPPPQVTPAPGVPPGKEPNAGPQQAPAPAPPPGASGPKQP